MPSPGTYPPIIYCYNPVCAAFQSFGSLIYLDIACAAFLLLEAIVFLWLLRRRSDRRFFAVPLVLGLLALALAWHHLLLYRALVPAGPVPPAWAPRQVPIYDGFHPPDWGYTVVLLILTASLAFAGLVKAFGKEPRWRL